MDRFESTWSAPKDHSGIARCIWESWGIPAAASTLLGSFFYKIYLFTWLCRVLIAAHGIFIAAHWIFVVACGIFSCCMRALSCGMQDPVP